MSKTNWLAGSLAFALLLHAAPAQPQEATTPPAYDEQLARKAGGNENGMKQYVLVLLRTGATRVPDGEKRQEMFRGHFANMERLSKEGKLVLAGPFDGVDGWRGLFILAVTDIEEAKKIVATDPVIINGEMVAEYHKYFGSAALTLIPELHEKITKKP